MPKRTVSETLTPSDIDGRYATVVKIRPELPQDRMVKAQLAQAYRAPGADGLPLMADEELRSEVLELPAPDRSRRLIHEQMLMAQSPDIKKLQTAADEQRWMEAHPEIVADAEKRLGEALRLYPDQLQAIINIAVKQALGAQGAGPLLAQADQMAGGGGLGLPPGVDPMGALPGANPAALPSQLTMSPQEVLPDRTHLAQSQPRRNRAVNPG